jgi:hypothetical protein
VRGWYLVAICMLLPSQKGHSQNFALSSTRQGSRGLCIFLRYPAVCVRARFEPYEQSPAGAASTPDPTVSLAYTIRTHIEQR